MEKSFIVIGGGFFGCYVATKLRVMTKGPVTVLEREPGLMMRASYNNQARVHRGYHYPRNILTGMCSSTNFGRFISEFKECIYNDFEQYYAIGKVQSKVTASQYKTFCQRIGVPLTPAPTQIKAMFSLDLIEEVFPVEECAFDAEALTKIMSQRLANLDLPVKFNTEVVKVVRRDSAASPLQVVARDLVNGDALEYNCNYVINCAYSNINTVLMRSGVPKLHLKEELTEMAIVDLPQQLKGKGVTVMCGPFFSLMPFPPRSLHLMSHVRYTPHYYWYDRPMGSDDGLYPAFMVLDQTAL